jgi:SAM-dependent methyltransferase
MNYYDTRHNRLLFFETAATSEYWDDQWEVKDFKKEVESIRDGVYVEKFTKKFLPIGSKILEGGCGKGQYVYALKRWGFNTIGVDYAEKTVKRINQIFPELQVVKGDVRALPFENNSFDGYWSFGVIEHFYEGFDLIAKEMQRVIKPGGFLFVTFPHMSSLRRLKARLHHYPEFDPAVTDLKMFYQFALDEECVEKVFEQYHFILKERYTMDGVKGLKDEVRWLKPILQKIYSSSFIPFKIVRKVLNMMAKRWTSHSILLVFQLSKSV